MRMVPIALAIALAAIACDKKASHLDAAKKKHDAGDLDGALTELTIVKATAPLSPEAQEAATLATGWLVTEADRAQALDEKKRRLDEALEWTPASGEATARRCAVLVDLGQDAEASRCLGEGLIGKTPPPDAIVSAARAKLAKRRDEAEAKERAALLAGGGKAGLERIVATWPTSPEAKLAKEKLAHAGSLCAESFAADLEGAIAAFEKTANEDAANAKKAPLAARLEAVEKIGKDLGERAHELKNRGIEAEEHAIAPGEEKLQKTLHDGCWELADLAQETSEELRRPDAESEDSYDQHTTGALATFARKVKGMAPRLRRALTASFLACRP